MTHKKIKEALLHHCQENVNQRFSRIKERIAGIEESLFQESKSSAGDKHETGRAMLQIERENAGRQLQEIEQLQLLVHKINIHTNSEHIHLGSLVHTSNGIYFISISLGQVTIGSANYMCIGARSPIGKMLLGKKIGDVGIFNTTEIHITLVS